MEREENLDISKLLVENRAYLDKQQGIEITHQFKGLQNKTFMRLL